MRRSFRNLALVFGLLATGTWIHFSSDARADAKTEAEAKKADGEAMDLWLAADFKGAKAKLEGALKKCGKDKCGGEMQAALHRDLGVILFAMSDKKGGEKEFEAAVAADSGITLAKDYLDNPDVKTAWEKAKKGAAATPTVTTTTTGTGTATPPNPDAEGNLSIEAKTAPIGYVLPIVIDVPDGVDAEQVKVSYKTKAMDKYKVIEAKKEGGKYVTRIPCEDTQFQGEIKLYVRAYDADKNEVEHFGTLKKPAIVTLVEKMPEGEEAPSFPGGKEPDKCTDKGDCQPGFPCDPNANKKPQGSGCDTDDECQAGLACVDNDNGKKWCYETASSGTGEPGKKDAKGGKKLWFGADVQADFLFLGSADDICNDGAWACVKDGKDVGVKKDQGGIPTVTGGGGKTSGGPALGTIRAFVSVDYFITANIALGARLGFAFNGNPSANAKFFPAHAEGRLSYFLGKGPMAEPKGIKIYLLGAGGMGEFDAAVPNIVAVPTDPADADADSCVSSTGCRVSGVKAYRLAGRGFAALGGGFWYMVSPKVALNFALKILLPLPTFSPGIAPEIGFKF